MKFITCLEYKYTQVTVDLFCVNVTFFHCSVVACNYVSSFFLDLKECVVISKFGSTVSCGLTRETRFAKYKPIAWCTHLLECINVPPSTVTLSPNDLLAVKMKCSMGECCLSITRAAGLLDKVYNALKLRAQNFLINYVGVSVYCHLYMF